MDIKSYLEESINKVSAGFLNLGGRILITVITLFIGYWLIKWIVKLFKKAMDKLEVELGTAGFLSSILTVALYILLGFMVAGTFGVDAASIVAILGSAGVAIGLAIQGSLSNFAGGILIILLKPFKVGDYIIEDSNKNEGTVTEISLFYTKLQTIDERVVVLPNGTLANTSLTNVTQSPYRMLEMKFSVSYESDWQKAIQIVSEIMKEEKSLIPGREIEVYVDNLGDSSIVLGGRCYVKTEQYRFAKQRINKQILISFKENDIEIPYPKMVIYKEKTN